MPDSPNYPSSSYSTEAPAVALVFTALELTKLVAGVGSRSTAEKVGENFETIYRAVVHAWNNPRG